jgi:hypothetical protein
VLRLRSLSIVAGFFLSLAACGVEPEDLSTSTAELRANERSRLRGCLEGQVMVGINFSTGRVMCRSGVINYTSAADERNETAGWFWDQQVHTGGAMTGFYAGSKKWQWVWSGPTVAELNHVDLDEGIRGCAEGAFMRGLDAKKGLIFCARKAVKCFGAGGDQCFNPNWGEPTERGGKKGRVFKGCSGNSSLLIHNGKCVAESDKAVRQYWDGPKWFKTFDLDKLVTDGNPMLEPAHSIFCAPKGTIVDTLDKRYCCSKEATIFKNNDELFVAFKHSPDQGMLDFEKLSKNTLTLGTCN